MDTAYVSAFAALAGATIGGFTSIATSWLTQRTQLRYARREATTAELKALYSDVIIEASKHYVDALTHQTDDDEGLVGLYALVGRMRLVSGQAVVGAAKRVEEAITETYLGPNHTLHELMEFAHKGRLNVLREFSAASRNDIDARAAAIR